jgi:TPR repeat protein
MKTKPLTFLLALTFLFLFSGSSAVFAGDFREDSKEAVRLFGDALDAYEREDYQTAVRLFRLSVDKGDTLAGQWEGRAAQIMLGDMYTERKGLPQDSKEAVKWHRLFAEQGIAEAQFNLGQMFRYGQGVQQDYKEAFKWWRLAAQQGIAEAQFSLGLMYTERKGLPQDSKEAVKWHRLFAEQGIAEAQFNLGVMYARGEGVQQDYKEAIKWYRLAAEQGIAEAQFNLGQMFRYGQGVQQDYKEAFKWYRLAAEQGYAIAQFNLGMMYDKGRGVQQDHKEAAKWWKLAADQGFAEAQFGLGLLYQYRQGVQQDDKEAVKWYRLSAEQGFAEAQYNLGVMYHKGQGVQQDDKEAFKWYRLAAEQGIAGAQTNLGLMYANGKGVEQDYKQAVKWYRLAAEQGIAEAQFNLGVMYARGKGAPQDYVSAHMWYNLAGSKGIKVAIKNRNLLQKRMTPQQIAKAQEMVRNWKSSDRIKIAESPPSTPQPPKSKDVAIAIGTGFLFGSQDYIITNYHVVKGTSEVTVKFLNGESINAEVIARDTQNDVAVLKLTKSPSFQSREMRFGDSSMVRMGDKVFTIGYPSIDIMGFKPKYTEGVISAVTGIKDDPTVFQTTVPIQPGNSGGPLFNEKGEVVGLTTASLSLLAIESMGAVPQNVNYAVKSSFVKNTISTIPEALLSNRGIVLAPTDSNSRADFIEAISKNIVLILGKVD